MMDKKRMKSMSGVFLMCMVMLVCMVGGCISSGDLQVTDFDSIKLFELTNTCGTAVKITNYGATVTSIKVPDRNGKLADIALGYDRVEDYMNAVD
jgi:aldose 1-epimerase